MIHIGSAVMPRSGSVISKEYAREVRNGASVRIGGILIYGNTVLVEVLAIASLRIDNSSIVILSIACLIIGCFFAFARQIYLSGRNVSVQPAPSVLGGDVALAFASSVAVYDTVVAPARSRVVSGEERATEPPRLPHTPNNGPTDRFWIAMLAGLRALAQANLWMASRQLRGLYDEYLLAFRGYASNSLIAWEEETRASFEQPVSVDIGGDQIDREQLFSAAMTYMIARYAEAAESYRHHSERQFGSTPRVSAREQACRDALDDLQRRSIAMPNVVTWRTVSMVLPAYNEEQVIAETAAACLAVIRQTCPNAEIIIVDDGSRDNTGPIIDGLVDQNASFRSIHNRPNRGYGGALRTGFAVSMGEYTFFMDSDGQFDPAEIGKLLTLARSTPGSAVIGYRAKRNDPPMRRVNAWGWKQVTRITLGLSGIRDIDCAFKLFPTATVRSCALSGEGAVINAEMLIKFRKMRVPIIQVPVTHMPREKGSPTGANLRVILLAFKELYRLRLQLTHWQPATSTTSSASQGDVDGGSSPGTADPRNQNDVTFARLVRWLQRSATALARWVRHTSAQLVSWLQHSAAALAHWMRHTSALLARWVRRTSAQLVRWARDIAASLARWVRDIAVALARGMHAITAVLARGTRSTAALLVRGMRSTVAALARWVRHTAACILAGPIGTSGQNPIATRTLVLLGIGLWVATRFSLVVFTFMSSMFEAGHTAPATVFFPAVSLQPIQMLKGWYQWDANWYVLIATRGYWRNATAFFPLYPMLIHLGIGVTGAEDAWIVGLVINNLATLIGCVGIVFFAYQETRDRGDAKRTLLFILCYPLAFFLAAPYTEGLLLATASWAFWAMRRGNWWVAVACVFLASVSRPTGFALYPPLLFEFARQQHWGRDLIRIESIRRWLGRSVVPALAVLISAPLGFSLYALYCLQQFGDPLIWIHVDHSYFGRVSMPIWESLQEGFSFYLSRRAWTFMQFHTMTDFIPLVAMMALTIVLSLRQPVAFTLYMGALVYLTIAAPQPVGVTSQHLVWYMSAGRYLLPSFPVWLALARWSGRRPWLETVLVYGGILLQAVCATQFLLGRWMV